MALTTVEFCHMVSDYYAKNNCSTRIPASWYRTLLDLDFQHIADIIEGLARSYETCESRYRDVEPLISLLRTEDDAIIEIRVNKCIIVTYLTTLFDERLLGNNVDASLDNELGLSFRELVKESTTIMKNVIQPVAWQILNEYNNLSEKIPAALQTLGLHPVRLNTDTSLWLFLCNDETVKLSLDSANRFSLSVTRGEGDAHRVEMLKKHLSDEQVFNRTMTLTEKGELQAIVFFYRAQVSGSTDMENILNRFWQYIEILYTEYALYTAGRD